MKKSLFLSLLWICSWASMAQTTYKEHRISAKKAHTFDPSKAEPDYNATIIHQEAPSPDGESYRSFLMRKKIESREKYPIKKAAPAHTKKKTSAAEPAVGTGFSKYHYFVNGQKANYSGGIPNDNALAVSNGGILLSAINSVVWGYDIEQDTTIFQKHILSLSAWGYGSPTDRYYDPKMIYDEEADRFILVFLRDSDPATSAFMVAFSSTNNPLDPWYVYDIDGNPLNNNRWTDFPAISITDNELFLTGNLIVPGVPWQVGFDGSVIWQVSKEDGYNNADSLRTKLFSDIRFGGNFIRNLHAVRGLKSRAPRQFFMSNRNFDITNDTMFVLEVTGKLDNSTLSIQMGQTSPNYGVPPNGRQQDTDLNDPTKGLQTNDARVLGAITNGDWIQFVSTTVNPSTGLAAIYHGRVENPASPTQTISGTIISDSVRDYGYPNIAFTGNEDCDQEVIIGFNHTSPTDFPGVSAVYYDNSDQYSNVITLKEGENFCDAHSDSYERWGDYFGIQPKYNEPGTIWTSGFFGLMNNQNGTWINQLSSPDSNQLSITTTELGNPVFCEGLFQVSASGGVGPYQYSFNGSPLGDSNILDSLCDGDTISYMVVDDRGCQISGSIVTPKVNGTGNGVYPNPFTTKMVAEFSLAQDQIVKAYIFDMSGNLVDQILNTRAKSGRNELQFDMAPLRNGQYILRVTGQNDQEILVQKVFKLE